MADVPSSLGGAVRRAARCDKADARRNGSVWKCCTSGASNRNHRHRIEQLCCRNSYGRSNGGQDAISRAGVRFARRRCEGEGRTSRTELRCLVGERGGANAELRN
eukprot:2836442-Pleurochrysis_carterae.AAC.1